MPTLDDFATCSLKYSSLDLLDISRLSEPTINENAIDWLVMKPAVNKETIKAICETYTHDANGEANFHADFIQGKGEGQIFLLHGPPGTGKTLTAGEQLPRHATD